jgi:hypothetical protein
MAEEGKVTWKDEDEVNGIRIGPWSINGKRVEHTDGMPMWITKGQARAEADRLGYTFEEF